MVPRTTQWMMYEILLPRLAGTRHSAAELVGELPGDLAGHTVAIDAADNITAAPGFVDELCKQVLVTRSASALEVSRARLTLAADLDASAARRGVREQLRLDIRLA